MRRQFETLVEQIRGQRGYHCLLAYSGGKDSTYTLMLLRRTYGLRMLAVTFDNGFLSEKAVENCRRMVEALDADYLLVKPRKGLMTRLFAYAAQADPFPPKTLERASSVCNVCIGFVKCVTMRIAIERRIPMVAFGWSPGQATPRAALFRTNGPMLRRMQAARVAPFADLAQEELQPFLLEETHFDASNEFPFSANPLAFHAYDEGEIIESIAGLGWRPPTDTDGNSSNCLLNALANRLHLKRYGFHPYAAEVAALVRDGLMDRSDGLAKLDDLGPRETAEAAAHALGLEGVLRTRSTGGSRVTT
jgi:hypothetical protein